jgi:hypothetical protein
VGGGGRNPVEFIEEMKRTHAQHSSPISLIFFRNDHLDGKITKIFEKCENPTFMKKARIKPELTCASGYVAPRMTFHLAFNQQPASVVLCPLD